MPLRDSAPREELRLGDQKTYFDRRSHCYGTERYTADSPDQ
jgi:hypothetical protein